MDILSIVLPAFFIIILVVLIFMFRSMYQLRKKAFQKTHELASQHAQAVASQQPESNKNPISLAAAKIVSKRIDVSSSTHHEIEPITNQPVINQRTSTDHYITFELETGSRLEFRVSGQEYGLLVEKDVGKLKFQGKAYLSFERSS